jgi:Ala-tRNA(Pro) deacylase
MNDTRAFCDLLDRLGIAAQTVQHEAVYTAAEHANRDLTGWEFPVKNILVEDKDGQLYLVTMHLSTLPLDLKELAKRLGANGRFSFASPETLAQTLKVLPGSVTPFALFNDRKHKVHLILDERLRKAATISAHPLVNTMTTTIATADFLRLLAETRHRPQRLTLPLKATKDR